MRVIHTVAHAVQEGPSNATVITRGGVAAYKTITEHFEVTLLMSVEELDAEATAILFGAFDIAHTVYIESDQDLRVNLWGLEGNFIDISAGFPLAIVSVTGFDSVWLNNLGLSQATVRVVLGA